MVSVIAIAIAAPGGWWPARAVILLATVILSIFNVRSADLPTGHYLDMRSAFQMVFRDYHRGDAVVLVGTGGTLFDLDYYTMRIVPRGVRVSLVPPPAAGGLAGVPRIANAVRRHETVWLVNTYTNRFTHPRLRDYRLTEQHTFPGARYIRVSRLAPA
jgi:hypothetical protein